MTLAVAQVPENILPVLLDIQHALEMCQTVDDAAYLRRKSKAMEGVAKEADATLEIKLEATELRIRAERRLGQLLAAAPKNKGAEGKFTLLLGSQVKMDPTPTLAEQGVSKQMAESARALAKIEAKACGTSCSRAMRSAKVGHGWKQPLHWIGKPSGSLAGKPGWSVAPTGILNMPARHI